jgi:signal peptidase I
VRALIPKPTTGWGAMLELFVIVLVAVGLALLIQATVVKPYEIPSGSMEPTLDIGQRVLVDRLIYDFRDPKIGDIVVFHPPVSAEQGRQCADPQAGEGTQTPCDKAGLKEADTNYIKRIVAGPGDRLTIRAGHPVVNGIEPREGYINRCTDGGTCNMPHAITIPDDTYFVMGDNRGQSDDSRYWGPVPRDWIIGEAFLTYWPPDRAGLL